MVRTRNRGVDLLRIISMIMIVVLHILGHGGILDASDCFSLNYGIAWFLEAAATCAVNCYALISGYVGIQSEFKYSNIVFLWFQVMLYSVSGTIIGHLYLYGESLKKRELFMAFFPVTYEKYWYFKAYFIMFFFIPFFNFLICNLKKEHLRKLVITIIVLASFFPTVTTKDISGMGWGYSALWLAMLYLIGGYIRKYQISIVKKKSNLLKIYGICVVVSWAFKILLDYLKQQSGGVLFTERINVNYSGMTLMQYNSPTMLMASVALMIWFANLDNLNEILEKIVIFAAPAAFGVYLIHDHPLIRQSFLKDKLIWLSECTPLVMTGGILLIVCGIFLTCLMVDRVRVWFFQKLRVKQCSEMLVQFLHCILSVFIRRMYK